MRIRKMEENRALADLSRVLMRHNRQEEGLVQNRRLIEEEIRDLSSQTEGFFDPEYYRMHDRYLERLEREIRNHQDELERIRPELEKEKRKVVEAAKKRRVVELLEEKAKERFHHELRKQDAKTIEESNLFLGHRGQERLPFPEKKKEERPYDYEWTEEGKRGDTDESETPRNDEGDWLSDYFKNLGMEDPRKPSR